MRFSFYAAVLACTTSAVVLDTESEADAYANYLWAQMESGEMSAEEGQFLAEEYANALDQDELAQVEDMHHISFAEVDGQSQPIMTDLKWLGSKMLNGVKAVGRGIDAAYDKTKAGIKAAGKAVINAPGNAMKAGNNWLKKHNFKAQTGQKMDAK